MKMQNYKRYLISIMSFVVVLILSSISVKAQEETLEIVDTSDYLYTYAEMVEDLIIMTELYPDKISISEIGVTADNRSIYQIVMGNPNAEHAVYLQASIHAREWMNSMLLMAQLEMNLKRWDEPITSPYESDGTYGELFEKCAVYIVPMVNPDGVTIAQFGLNGINSAELRANLSQMSGIKYYWNWKANARGVDLNRNFSVGFGLDPYIKSSPASSGYPGTEPFSENETIAVRDAMSQRTFDAIVHYHSCEDVIYWDFGQTGILREHTESLANYLSQITGYRIGIPDPIHGLEYTWDALELQATTALIETGSVPCPLPYTQWENIWNRNKEVYTWLALGYLQNS